MPAGLDFVSLDVYNRGAIEVKVARQHYGHYLLPLLKPHQHVWLVPGLYGPNGTEGNATATEHNDAELVEKLSAHLAWARSDSRIAGFAAWHWGTLPPDFSPRSMTIGGGFYPRTLALVAQIVANASTAALKTEDAPAGSRGRPHARCDVTHGPFAAVGDGKHDDTEAIRSALKQCDSVLLPAGKRFLTGPLNLTSNQALIVDGTLLASTRIADYPLVAPLASYGWSIDSNCFPFGVEIVPGALNYQAIINSWNASNVTVRGRKPTRY